MISIHCLECRTMLSFPEAANGQVRFCAICGSKVEVPRLPEQIPVATELGTTSEQNRPNPQTVEKPAGKSDPDKISEAVQGIGLTIFII